MKKLALVLGSLLVVGSVASAKEVMPAPMQEPEVIVKVVERPVVVYRDRIVEVENKKWRPSGSVSVDAKTFGYTENGELHKKLVEKDGEKVSVPVWKGEAVHQAKLTTKANIQFAEKQNLSVKVEDLYRLDRNHGDATTKNKKVVLGHSYDFGKINGTEIAAEMTSEFTRAGEEKELVFKPVFDFSEYFFKNDYVKATALQLAPVYTYTWTNNVDKSTDYTNEYALYANAEFELPYGVTFQAEFDKFFAYGKDKKVEGTKNEAYKVGDIKFALGYGHELYAEGKHSVKANVSAEYETKLAWSKNDKSVKDEEHGTVRTKNNKKERWGSYTVLVEPSVTYTYKATEYAKLFTTLGAEYKNREEARHAAKTWRWQPYAQVGFKASF